MPFQVTQPVSHRSAVPIPPPPDINGYTQTGDYVKTVHIEGPDGMRASILTMGARLLDLRLQNGPPLTLSPKTLPEIESDNAYIGVAVGRTANRIRGGLLKAHPSFTNRPPLERNDNDLNHTHGGKRAWDKRLFAVTHQAKDSVTLFLYSPDGDQGYPGSVKVNITYRLSGNGKLDIALITTNVDLVQTVTNMTLHPYFDLSGSRGVLKDSAENYCVHAPSCSKFLILDANNVPTGEVALVSGTKFDFREPRMLVQKDKPFEGYDNYFIATENTSLDAPMRSLVTITGPMDSNGKAVKMEVISNQPGFQMYTANGFNGSGPDGFAQYGSVAVEPSGFIDAANHKHFPTIALEPRQTRRQLIQFKFSVV